MVYIRQKKAVENLPPLLFINSKIQTTYDPYH